MIEKYKTVSIIYGGTGKKYAQDLHQKIAEISKIKRYPINSKLILESILTQELLSGVINLIKDSDVCVAFLTADDVYTTEQGKRFRIRQNIVFELGMALLHLGREKCIILADFDIKDKAFELPSDMNSLEIRQFPPERSAEVMQDIIDKILSFNQTALYQSNGALGMDCYDQLLTRELYYVEYENLFKNNSAKTGSEFLKEVLETWLNECKSFTNYDERCVFLVERIGFLPIFGMTSEVTKWMTDALNLLERYTPADVVYYHGTDILDFSHRLVVNVITYTQMKRSENIPEAEQYKKLLEDFLYDCPPSGVTVNPLFLVAYYDYLGLTYMKIAGETKDRQSMEKAKEAFEKAVYYTASVDMSLQIWSGFLQYNLARVNGLLGEVEKSIEHYQKAIKIRKRWLQNSQYNITIRNALSYEYFIAKIDYVNTLYKTQKIDEKAFLLEYQTMETELTAYSDKNDSIERLLFIKKLLKNKSNEINE